MNFEKGYFVNSKISNYKNYSKRKFVQQTRDLIQLLDIKQSDYILDFGCATGGLLYEFKKMGYVNICGTDISYWSIQYGKEVLGLEKELRYYSLDVLSHHKDHLIMLDVLEHIPTVEELEHILKLASTNLLKSCAVRIPVCNGLGDDFVLDVSRRDKTHTLCYPKDWWKQKFLEAGFKDIKPVFSESIYDSDGVYSFVASIQLNKDM